MIKCIGDCTVDELQQFCKLREECEEKGSVCPIFRKQDSACFFRTNSVPYSWDDLWCGDEGNIKDVEIEIPEETK